MKMKAFIIRPNYEYNNLFRQMGYELVSSIVEADLVVFTGGEDVSPSLYNEKRHPQTNNNPVRDEREVLLFNQAREMGLLMVGICRGGQFLNVMNGGKMYQHVNNHGIHGTHAAFVPGIGEVKVTSTHHQMMRPNVDADPIILMTAALATQKQYMRSLDTVTETIVGHSSIKPLGDDIEAVYYPSTNCLCFQPHPEFTHGIGDTATVFKFFVNNYLIPRLDFEVSKEFQKINSSIYDGINDNI